MARRIRLPTSVLMINTNDLKKHCYLLYLLPNFVIILQYVFLMCKFDDKAILLIIDCSKI